MGNNQKHKDRILAQRRRGAEKIKNRSWGAFARKSKTSNPIWFGVSPAKRDLIMVFSAPLRLCAR